MRIKKMSRCFGIFGFLFVGTAVASEMTSQTPPSIFQKAQEGYSKFALPLENINREAVEKAVTHDGIDALELNSLLDSFRLFYRVGHVIKKLLVRQENLTTSMLTALSVFPQASLVVDVDSLNLFADETDEQVGKILSVCTDKLSGLFLYNTNLTLSFLDKVPAEKFKNVKTLLLGDMSLLADKLQTILNGAPNLEEVKLHYVGVIKGLVTWENQKNVKKLSLQGTTVPIDFLKNVLTYCLKLACFKIKSIDGSISSLKGLQHNALKEFELDYYDGGLSDEDLVLIGMVFPNLTRLKVPTEWLETSEEIAKKMLEAQQRIPFLKKLLKEIANGTSLGTKTGTMGEANLSLENVDENMRKKYRVTIEEI